jgi:hypothetical protein
VVHDSIGLLARDPGLERRAPQHLLDELVELVRTGSVGGRLLQELGGHSPDDAMCDDGARDRLGQRPRENAVDDPLALAGDDAAAGPGREPHRSQRKPIETHEHRRGR